MRFIIYVTVASCFLPYNAIAEGIDCPKQIEVQERLINGPATWNPSVFPNVKRDFFAVEFRQVGDQGRLHYDDENIRDGSTVYSYWFTDKDATYQVVCTYADTHVELVRDLPRGTRQCDVKYVATVSGRLVFKKAECFSSRKY